MKILIWLHNNNFIDATLSNLKDTTLPFLDCSIIKSNYNVISLLINQYGICILENYFNDNSINISLPWFNTTIRRLNVDNNIVNNDELDLEEYKRSRQEYANAEFILNDFLQCFSTV